MNSSFRPRQAPMQRQAQRLADQGRYGDSMMVHMNPTEVQVLNQMAPNGLTRNPQTGQPEAFALLGSLLASMLAKAGATAGATAAATGAATPALAKLGTALTLGTGAPVVAGAVGSGLTTAIQTGDLMEGVKAGVIGGLTGKVAGDLIGGLAKGGTEAVQQAGQGAAGSGAAGEVIADAGTLPVPTEFTPNPAVYPNSGGTVNMFAAPDTVIPSAAPDAGGMFANLGETFGDMNVGDIAGPTIAGFVGDDAIAMYPGDGGDMEEEEKDDFYQEVRPGDRGIQMPEMGYDAGAGGEFDYFANPFQVIPVAKTGGHVRKFQTGGQTDEPIQLTGLRGFDQVTPPPSFDFSSSNIYGPAPVNQAETNLSTAGPANIASTTPVASPFAGIGMFNFGRGGRREYGPTDAEMFSYLTGRGGMPSNLPSGVGTVETPDFSSRVPGRFPRASYEDLAMESMRKEAIPMSDRTDFQQQGSMRIPMESDKRYFQQQGSQMPSDRYQTKSIREAFGDRLVSQYSRPETGGIGGRNPNLPPQVIPGLDEAMEMSRLNVSPVNMMPGMQGGDFQIGNDANINVNPFMGDTMYSQQFGGGMGDGMNVVNPPMTATGDIGMRPRPDLMNPNFSTLGF